MPKTKRKRFQRLKNNLIFSTARFVFWAAGRIPLPLGMKIGAAIGSAAWRLLRYERECSRRHLRVAFPEWTDAEREAVGREAYRNLGRSFFELFHFDEILATINTDNPYVRWIGHEHMDAALAAGHGGINVTGHIGNWELMAAWSAASGDPVYEIVRSLYDPRLDKLLNDHRRKYNYVPLTRGGNELLADIVDVFQKNRQLGLLIDQDTKVRGVFADWFGHPAWTPSGPAYLCYQAGLDAVVTSIHRNPEGGHTVVTGPPIPRPQTGDMKADILAYTELFNRELCNRIRQYPAEWVWMHRRWKTRPPGEPPEKHPAPRPTKPHTAWRWLERAVQPRLAGLSWEKADALGAGLGRLLSRLMRSRYRMVRENIARAFPDRERAWVRRTARAAFANFGRVLVEYLRHSLMDGRFFAERVEVEGLDKLEAAYAQGKGVLVVAAHYGGWEPAMWKLAALGYPLHLIAKRVKNKFLNMRLVWLRRARGVESHPAKDSAFAVVRALKRGHVLVTVMDQHATGKAAVDSEFFGRPVRAPGSTARLAARYGCPVLPAYSQRIDPGRYRVVIGDPLPWVEAETDEEAIRRNTRNYLAALEEPIRRDPTQWFWLHRRWR